MDKGLTTDLLHNLIIRIYISSCPLALLWVTDKVRHLKHFHSGGARNFKKFGIVQPAPSIKFALFPKKFDIREIQTLQQYNMF